MASIWAELKRRNVVRIAVAYAVVGWLSIEVAATILPILEVPDWLLQAFTVFVILGFPLALILSWVFDLTPRGLERTDIDSQSDVVSRVPGRTLNFTIIGALVLALGFVVVDNYVLVDGDVRDRSIAVLPFENLSPDAENAFFADGIHGELLTQLSKISALRVISRTSVMEYRDTPKNMREIGQELGVTTILEGDVRRAGNTVRINVQLINAETDEHLWAEIYDRELSARNVLSIQSEMATAIAEALQATLSPQETARISEVPTQNSRAYDFYLRGNDYASRADNDTSKSLSAQMYEQAVAEDPEFALAWAELARSYASMYFFGVDPSESRRQMAEAAVERAFELAPSLPEAHYARGYYYYQGLRDYSGALEEFAIAEPGMPGNAQLLTTQALVYRRMGNFEQSVLTMARAIELDPRSVEAFRQQAITYWDLREYELAEEHVDRLLAIAPDYGPAYAFKAWLPLNRDGDFSVAKSSASNPPLDLGIEGEELGWFAALYERDYDTALRYAENWQSDASQASYFGRTYQLAGQRELAEAAFRSVRPRIQEAIEASGGDNPNILFALEYVALGEVLAGLGEAESAMSTAREAMDLIPKSLDATWGAAVQLEAVIRVLIPAGDHEAAIDELDAYFAEPGRWSIEGILGDPRIDPIRNDPDFQALVEKYRRP